VSGAIVVASAIGIIAVALPRGAAPPGHRHPDPAPGVTAEKVVPGFLVTNAAAKPAYAVARAYPALLDGIYCFCNCSQSVGHRSLLSCFEDEHGAYCDICQRQAELAAQMQGRGAGLGDIRSAMDGLYGT
jgi:hypothetical protein